MVASLPVVVPPTDDPNALWTDKELAAWARVSQRTVQRWAATDRGPRRLWLNGRVRYRVGDVLEWAAARSEDERAGERSPAA